MAPGTDAAGRGPRVGRMRRLRLIRDLAVFQVKLVVDATKDILLSPLSFAAAVADLLRTGPRERMLFYRLMDAGVDLERRINLFGSRSRGPGPWTVDDVIETVESRVREGARPRDRRADDEGDEHE